VLQLSYDKSTTSRQSKTNLKQVVQQLGCCTNQSSEFWASGLCVVVVVVVIIVVVVVVVVGSRHWLLVQQSCVSPVGSAKPMQQSNDLDSSFHYTHLLRNCLLAATDSSELRQSAS